MNLGRLTHLRARRTDKLAELDQRDAVSVSSQLVALGRVRIVPAATSADAPPVEVTTEVGPVPDAQSEPAQQATVAEPRSRDDADITIGAQDDEPWSGAISTPISLADDDRPTSTEQEPPLAQDAPTMSGSDIDMVAAAVPVSDAAEIETAGAGTPDHPTPLPDLDAPATVPAASGSGGDPDAPHTDDAPRDVVESPDMGTEPLHARQLRFPEIAAVGPLFTRDWHPDADWERIGPARGTVSVPADVDVRLRVDRDAAADLSWLALLDPDDLFSLILDGDPLDQSALRIVARLSGLRELSLGDTSVGDGEVRALQPLSGLTALCLAGSRISNLGVLYVKPLGELRSLDLSRTAIDNGGIVHLSGLTNLEALILANTNVSDGGVVHLTRLPALRHLDLRGTRTTRAGRSRLSPDVEVLFDK